MQMTIAGSEESRELEVAKEESLLSIISRCALDPKIQVEKMQALLEMKERIDQAEAKKLFHTAMIGAQESMRPVLRNCENRESHSRYANLEMVDRSIRPVYTRHGFVLSFNSKEGKDGMLRMSCLCMHKGGHTEEYELSGHLDGTGIKGTQNKTGIMAAGSTVSYLRRYLTCMIFNVVLTNEDDDGLGDPVYIARDQLNRISDLIIACEMDAKSEAAFCKFMNATTVEHILERDFQKALTALTAKYKRHEEERKR